MHYNSPVENTAFPPLLEALNTIHFRLQRDGNARVIVAAPTLRRFKQQALPDHVETSVRPRRGPRVSVRGPRHLRTTRPVLARWPQDQQLEAAAPSLTCVLSGQADFHIADYMVHCRAGDSLFIPAGVSKPDARACYVADDTHRQCSLMWISPGSLQGQGLECWIVHSQYKTKQVGLQHGTSAIKNDFLACLFEQFNQEILNSRKPELEYSLLICLLLCMYREIEEGGAVVPWTRRLHRPVERQQSMIEEACKHIESHLDAHLTIHAMARLLAVSPATFTRRFRNETGQSFNEYLTNQRITGATALLRDTDLSVTDVAKMVGLKYERLRDLFQCQYDCSPGEFRKRRK